MVFFFISLYQLRRILFRLRILFSFLSEQWIVFNSANERTFSCVLDLLKNGMSVTGRLRMRDKSVFPSDIYPDICKIRIK